MTCLRYLLRGPSGRSLLYSGGALALLAIALPFRTGVVEGQSMEPSLPERRPFVYIRTDGSVPACKRGEVVLARVNGEVIIKRVFAVEGDIFWIIGASSDRIPNIRALDPATPFGLWRRRFPEMSYRRVEVPAGCVYLLGDGIRSRDSRHFGPVAVENIVGRVAAPPGEPTLGSNALTWNDLPPPPGGA